MMDIPLRARHAWLTVALLLGGILGFVLVSFIGAFVLGLFLYYASRPIHDRLRRRIDQQSLTAAVSLFLLVLPLILLFWYTASLAFGQLESIAELELTQYEEIFGPAVGSAGLTTDLQEIRMMIADPSRLLTEASLRAVATGIAASLTRYLGTVLSGLLNLFIAVALAFYLLRDDGRFVSWVRTSIPNETLVRFGTAVDADLKTVYFGNILNAVLTAIVGTVVFSLLASIAPPSLSVPVPILLGLLAGAGSLIPVVGMKIVYIPVVLYLSGLSAFAGFEEFWFPLGFFVVSFIVVDTVPELLIRPYVSGRNLHVGTVMFAYILGPLLFGWYGLFLGPLLLVVIVDFSRIVLPELFGQGDDGIQTTVTRQWSVTDSGAAASTTRTPGNEDSGEPPNA